MYTFAIRRKVTYFLLAASVILLLAAPAISAPVLADCSTSSSSGCSG